MKVTINSEHTTHADDLKSASGEYVFQYLINNKPVFTRENVDYPMGTGYHYNRKKMSYMLSYRDQQWRIRRKESNSKWQDAVILFRRKIDCKFQFFFYLLNAFNPSDHTFRYKCN